ncbi:MAG: helix-turn-helix domain-containing protein, partial [Gammaproteobacteria bacterium]|nr:helix-turn-helix domain-containing protein [Gammaproteobacteria bacterium]
MDNAIRTLSLPEAAKFLGIHKETARRLVACREVPAAKVGRSWRFLEEDLVTYLRSLYSNNASQSVVPNRSKTIWHSTKEKKSTGLI